MKNTLYQQSYKCSANHITKHYIWSSDLKKAKHVCHCGEKLTVANIHIENAGQFTAIRTETKNR